MARLTVDKGRCIGCGTCEAVCPEVFAVGSDKVAHVTDTGQARTQTLCAAEAAEACPQRAIVEVDG
jgi:ferredoxin